MISKRNRVILNIVSIIMGLLIIAPIIYAFLISMMTPAEMSQAIPKLIPSTPSLNNYKRALAMVPFGSFLKNSLFVSICVTLGQLVTCSLAAYAFSFFEFKGKRFLFLAVLVTVMIPGEVIIVSNYLTVSQLGWLDHLEALIIPFLTSGMGIFMVRQFYLTIPKELQEASFVDGCTHFKFLTAILMPLSKPVMASLGIYVFIHTWNQYMWPLLTINDPNKRTVQIGISMLQFSEGNSYEIILAGSLMIIIPSLIMFIFGQKQLVDGMVSGAVKG